ncbi:MAG: carbon-nitrogen hydrolase family protein [Candidatus Hodarchaeales archaeon]
MKLKIAALQLKIVAGQVETNLERVSRLMEEAFTTGKGVIAGINPFTAIFENKETFSQLRKEEEKQLEGVDILVLPEYFSGALPGTSDDELEQVPDHMRDLARQMKSLIVGTTLWKEENDKFSNRCFIFGPDGELGSFLKQKLFKREIDYGFNRGVHFFKFNQGRFRTGVAICNDAWWPEDYRHALKECHLVLIPTMTSVERTELMQYGRVTWWNLAMTRSKENVHYIVVADHATGPLLPGEISGHSTCGATMITNPWSRELENMAKAVPDGRECLLVDELAIDPLLEYRKYREKAGML